MNEATAASDLQIQATVRVRESLWKRVKIEAIRRGCTVAVIAEQAFEGVLSEPTEKPRKAKGEKP